MSPKCCSMNLQVLSVNTAGTYVFIDSNTFLKIDFLPPNQVKCMLEYHIFEEYIKWTFLRNFSRGCGGLLRLLFNKLGVYIWRQVVKENKFKYFI